MLTLLRTLRCGALLTSGLLVVPTRACGAEDPAPVGSKWSGVLKGVTAPNDDGNRIRSTDAVLQIVERDGEEFKGLLALDRGRQVREVEGRITSLGGVTLTSTKFVKVPKDGDPPADHIGQSKVIGSIKRGR